MNPSYSFTATDAFLVHSSCYNILKGNSQSEIDPNQLFKLCQSLQPDRQRDFGQEGEFELLGKMN